MNFQNPAIKLNNGVEMPLFQLGTSQMILPNKPDINAPSGFCGFQPERTYRQIELALRVGMRAFDTALNYHHNQPWHMSWENGIERDN